MNAEKIYIGDKSVNDLIDELEYWMYNNIDLIDAPLKHTFLPGLYIREIFMPKDSKCVSLIHAMHNPFFVMKGKVSIYSTNDGEQTIEAPFQGITTPMTRRVLYIHEDCVWITVHVTNVYPENDSKEAFDDAVERVENQIIVPHVNKLLGGYLKNNILTPLIENNEPELIET